MDYITKFYKLVFVNKLEHIDSHHIPEAECNIITTGFTGTDNVPINSTYVYSFWA